MSDFQVVKYKKNKCNFEVLVKPQTVLKYKNGKLQVDDVIYSETVFTNAQKGDKAKIEDLKIEFGEKSEKEYVIEIINEGEYQLSTQERKELQEKKKKEIMNYIHKYYTDPRTKKPHPFTRIETAFPLIKYNVDIWEATEKQAAIVVKKFIDIQLPMSKDEVEAVIKLKHQFIGSAMAIVKKYTTVRRENYDGQGVTLEVTMIPGDYDILLKELNTNTKGEYEFNVAGQSVDINEDLGDKKGKKKGGQKEKEPKNQWKGGKKKK
eukprot:gene1491-12108_t